MIGKDCKITEPIYGTQFDLNPLYSDLGLKIKSENLEFNVCGKLNKKCNGSDAAAILHLDNGSEICFGELTEITKFFILKKTNLDIVSFLS